MLLDGITRAGSSLVENPAPHAPLVMQNKVNLEVLRKNADGEVQVVNRGYHEGNIMASYGLDWLVSSVGAGTPAASWALVSYAAIGTSPTAPATTNTALGGSVASVSWGAGDLTGGRKGARTLSYGMTFDGTQANTLQEVGLFASNSVTASMIARQTFASVIKQSQDTVHVSYDIVATTP